MKIIKPLFCLLAVALQAGYSSAQPQPPPAGAGEPSYGAPPDAGRPAAVPGDVQGLSPAAAEVVRLSESGVGDGVVLSYIQNAQARFELSADDVVYLKDVGISESVTTAMLDHDRSAPGQGIAPSAPYNPPPPQAVEAPLTPSVEPEYVSNAPEDVNYFYNDLRPYGAWVDLEGLGWCWQPTVVVVDRSWSPYCNRGHWVYSDCGWYWQSDYSWGWAPFHYGRWERHQRCGWVWMPDRVWGPAWVTWRVGGDSCGWAPLPAFTVFDARDGWHHRGRTVGFNFDFGLPAAHFTFVGLHDFTTRDIGRARYSQTQVVNVYNRTTVINKYTVNNRTIVNEGIPVDRVRSATHTDIRRATLRDAPAGGGNAGNIARNTRNTRDSSVVYRHPLPSQPVRQERIVAQKVDDRHPVVQHNVVAPHADNARTSGTGGFTTQQRNSRPAVPDTRNQNTSRAVSPDRSTRNNENYQPGASRSTTTTPGRSVQTPDRNSQSSSSSGWKTSADGSTRYQTSPRDERSSAATPDRGNYTPRSSDTRNERSVTAPNRATVPDRTPYTPPPDRGNSNSRSSDNRSERSVTAPNRAAVPERTPAVTERQPTPRNERVVTAPSAPSRQPITRSEPAPESRSSRAYSPKGYDQAPQVRSSRASEPEPQSRSTRSESRSDQQDQRDRKR